MHFSTPTGDIHRYSSGYVPVACPARANRLYEILEIVVSIAYP